MRRQVIPIFALVLLASMALPGPVAEAQRGKGDKGDQNVRALHGQVTDRDDVALEKAVVYLKNTRNLQVRTFITGQDGNYHFHGLGTNVDYEVHAQYNGVSSPARTLSSFDSRKEVYLNLKVDTRK